jgi:ammonium transporter, Amt family
MATNIDATITIFTEFYYWVTIVFMFLIHIGFCLYEVGASRRRNHLSTLMKNSMAIPLVTITFYFFGWWIYFAFPGGLPDPSLAKHAAPWSQLMSSHLSGHS